MGAWIETDISEVLAKAVNDVAPRVGAWIETFTRLSKEENSESHPVWVRGLKPPI